MLSDNESGVGVKGTVWNPARRRRLKACGRDSSPRHWNVRLLCYADTKTRSTDLQLA